MTALRSGRAARSREGAAAQRVLIDTDCGVDDAVAAAILLSDPATAVAGIGTTDGNCSASQAAINVTRLLACAGCADTPLSVGTPSLPLRTVSPHGSDGFGDVYDRSISPRATTESPAQRIVRSGRERPGELVLLALGPLTNLAAALDLDASALRRFRRVVICGGMGFRDEAAVVRQRYPEYLVKGDTNTALNPDATERVVQAPGTFTWIGMNVTGLFRFRVDRVCAEPPRDPLAALLREIHGKYIAHCTSYYRATEPIFTSHDGVAATLVANPSFIRSQQPGVPAVASLRSVSSSRPELWAQHSTAAGHPKNSQHHFVTAVNERKVADCIAAAFRGVRGGPRTVDS